MTMNPVYNYIFLGVVLVGMVGKCVKEETK